MNIKNYQARDNRNDELKKIAKKNLEHDKINDRFFFIREGKENLKKRLWANTKRYISGMKNIADEKDVGFAIFIMPMEAQISSPEEMSTASQFYFKEPPTEDFDKVVKSFCEQNNIDFIDMLPIFRDNKNLDPYFPKEGHLTEEGHRLVAGILFEYMKNKVNRRSG